MKKESFVIFVVLIVLIIGCKTKETIIVGETKKMVTTESDSLRPWTQDQLPNLKMSDSLYFYNDRQIKIQRILSEKKTFTRNHKIVSYDSTFTVIDSIPARTAGKLISEPNKGKGGINFLHISFKMDSTITNLFFVRNGSLPQKIIIYKNSKGKEVKRENAPKLKDPEYCVVDSDTTRIKVYYKKNKYSGEVLSGKNSIILISNKEYKGEKKVIRIAKSLTEE